MLKRKMAYGKYQQTQVQTADKGSLLLMLYDALILSIKRAQTLLRSQSIDRSELSKQTTKARDIIYELMGALDTEAGGEFAESLVQLYDYFHHRIGTAVAENDPLMLDDVLDHLQELRKAWAGAVQKDRASQTQSTSRATASTAKPIKQSSSKFDA